MSTFRTTLVFYCALAVVACLFISRAALSISTGLFITACFLNTDGTTLRRFFRTPVLWGTTLLFVVPLISGLWSEDQVHWSHSLRIKIPLLLLPVAFASMPALSMKQTRILLFTLLALVVAGTAWSMGIYLTHMHDINQGYLRSASLPTPFGNDHVRFSWLVSVTLLATVAFLYHCRDKTIVRWLLLCTVCWLVAYLHILAARTGLLCLYAGALIGAVFLARKNKTRWQPAILLVLLIVIPLTAWFALPTFRNKVKYFYYDSGYFREAHYLPGGNDATRIISLKAGIALLQQHPVQGVGFGDIGKESSAWYDRHYPGMLASDKILPSAEWLLYASGAGYGGLLLFLLACLLPFFARSRYPLTWFALNLMIITGFLFDIGLETQYGVAVYCFALLAGWKWACTVPRKP